MNKILIHTIAFSPDGVSTAYLYNDIALRFKEEGFDVVVLTTTPHYNAIDTELKKQPLKRKCLGLYYASNFNGILVKHIPQRKFKNSILRIIGFVYWHFISFILGLFEKNVAIFISPSPPLTIGFINILLAKLKKSKTIYNVQEIYPDLLIEEGGLKSRPIISILRKLEKFVYNKSNIVTTIDAIFYNSIVERFKNQSKLHIIPNFVDTTIYKPIDTNNINLDPFFFPNTNSLKLMYAGNIGHAQDWESLLQVTIALKEENIDFLIIGEGVMKKILEKKISEYQLRRVHLIPYQHRELMPSLIAYSDIQFIFMSPHTEGHGFPSKTYTIMACAKPMLVCSGPNTPIINFLKDKDCAFLVEEKTLNEKVNAIIKIFKTDINTKELNEMGKRGFENIRQNYTKETVTLQYVNLVKSIL